VRFICDNQDYSEGLADQIEEKITPLLKCIEDPVKINFEDDIILTISSLIKKRKAPNANALHYL
jgi:hypothetical protein